VAVHQANRKFLQQRFVDFDVAQIDKRQAQRVSDTREQSFARIDAQFLGDRLNRLLGLQTVRNSCELNSVQPRGG
jgi:hypothetical protein